MYLSAALIPLMFRSGCHPWIHLYTKLDLIIGAQIGHDGFDAPGRSLVKLDVHQTLMNVVQVVDRTIISCIMHTTTATMATRLGSRWIG